MKKVFLLSFLFVLFSIKLFSNNLVIGAPTYNASTNKITFTIKWDNSWRVNTGPSNWDAVWVFVKRQPCGANGIWSHAILSSTSSEHAVSGTFGLVADAVADGMGVFVHRPSAESNAIGSFSTTSEVSLKLSGVYNPELTGSSSSSDNEESSTEPSKIPLTFFTKSSFRFPFSSKKDFNHSCAVLSQRFSGSIFITSSTARLSQSILTTSLP